MHRQYIFIQFCSDAAHRTPISLHALLVIGPQGHFSKLTGSVRLQRALLTSKSSLQLSIFLDEQGFFLDGKPLSYHPLTRDEWSQLHRKRNYPDDTKSQAMLGEGSFGTTYRMTYGGQVAAVKVVRFQGLGVDFDAVLKEIETLMNLKHQNVVGYKGYFRDSGLCLAGMAMEYASGGTLYDMCLMGNKIENRMVLVTNWLMDVSAGIEYVHGQGGVHRDLKSANVLLSWSKSKQRHEAKLADFGLAVMQSSTAASQLKSRVGTSTHFSPERAHGEGYGKPADMWAVGCILLEIVLGQPLTEPVWSEREIVKNRRENMLASVKSNSELLWQQAVGLLQQDVEARMSAQNLKFNLSQVLPRT